MKTHKLYKGSKNPEVGSEVFLRTKDGEWGVAKTLKDGSSVCFDFRGLERTFYGEKKEAFVAYIDLKEV